MGRRARLKALSKTWTSRTLQTGRVAASVGKAAVKRAVGSADDLGLGEDLVDRLDGMKGLAMKVGQIASYLEGAMPPATAERLRKLQSDAEPMDADVIAHALATGLPDATFERFDEAPVAAASIGQVHRARVAGREVAVKIQYPGVRETLAIDLGNVGKLSRLFNIGMATDTVAVVEELRARFDAECDYTLEAGHQELGARLLRGHSGVFVPGVVRSHCSETVFTSEWVEGRGFHAFVAASTQAERDAAAAAIFGAVFQTIFRHGVFNADPQPGNFLFADDGVALIDWGCTCVYGAPMIRSWKNLARVTLEDRRADLPEALERCGFVPRGKRYDYDEHWRMMEYLYRPFKTPGFRYTPEYVKESWALFGPDNPNMRRISMPPEWVFVNRLQWGLNSILAGLSATGPFGELFREGVYAPFEGVPEQA